MKEGEGQEDPNFRVITWIAPRATGVITMIARVRINKY